MARLVKVALVLLAFAAVGTVTLAAQTKPTLPPLRGLVELGYLKPVTSVDHKAGIVTTIIKVKNISTTGSIAGLKVEEYWFDKGGNPVGGSKARLAKPLGPGEVAELKLETQKSPLMNANSYTFTHANGKIKTKLMSAF
jgi:hypothetical protein